EDSRCLNRVEAVKSVRKDKKRVVLVGNRYRTGRSASRRLEEFLLTEGLLLVARIPEREIYSNLARDGLTVFDVHNKAAHEQQQAWLPLVRAIETADVSGLSYFALEREDLCNRIR